MAHHCVKCNEVWKYEDYVCPCCGSAAIDTESRMKPTLKYVFDENDEYDVIRISTNKSVFDESDNYMNKE